MSKTGNNTGVRILVAIIFAPLIVYACYVGGLAFFTLSTGIALLSFFEYSRFIVKKGGVPLDYVGYVSILAIMLDAQLRFMPEPTLLYSLIVLAIVLRELFHNDGSPIINIGTSLFGVFFFGLFMSALLKLNVIMQAQSNGGNLFIILLLMSIWIMDSAAFFIGIRFGKHRLYERVSPKKSWEGAVAGFVFAVVTVVAASQTLMPFLTLTHAIGIGAVIGVVGQMGDLVESLLKRDAGVKDSSSIIPGHGGIFDRFDSLFAVAPAVYIYVSLFMNL